MRKNLLLLVLIALHQGIHSQCDTIKGRIISSISFNPISGVDIQLKNDTVTTKTNSEGYFHFVPTTNSASFNLVLNSYGYPEQTYRFRSKYCTRKHIKNIVLVDSCSINATRAKHDWKQQRVRLFIDSTRLTKSLSDLQREFEQKFHCKLIVYNESKHFKECLVHYNSYVLKRLRLTFGNLWQRERYPFILGKETGHSCLGG